MSEIFPFFIVLFATLFFSELFRRLHLPWVVALILGGIIIGPFGLDILKPNTTIDFLAEVRLVFLMFMAGLETKISSFRKLKKGKFSLPLINGGLPFLVGLSLGLYFGLELQTALLLGIVFISSSVAVILPSLEANNLMKTRLGKSIIATTILEDVSSLILLSILFQTVSPLTTLPLPAFYALLLATFVALRWLIPRVRKFFAGKTDEERHLFQRELRTIFAILIGTVIAFELLGLHPIIAGFFAGFVLSDSVTSKELKDKLRVLSYGLFIPIFFIVIGSKTDIGVFFTSSTVLTLTSALIIGSVLSKFFGGVIAGKFNKFTLKEGALIGVATMPQLSTTLAITFTGFELGIISQELVTALVALTVVTTMISPLLMKFIVGTGKNKLGKT